MKKYWIALLVAIAATQAIAGEKEYIPLFCEGDLAVKSHDCSKCKKLDSNNKIKFKFSFKVSKELKAVMQTVTLGSDSSSTIDKNCIIFDDNSFQCEKIDGDYTITTTVSHGKYEIITLLTNGETFGYACGYETKNIFNFLDSYSNN